MADTPSSQSHHASFEGSRREDEHGHEYWSARELAPLLEYRKVVSPAIEYQESLLELAVGNPAALNTLGEDVDEIQFLAA